MKKFISALITAGLLITATTATTARSESVKLTGRSVIYDSCCARYIVFFTDNNNHKYTYQVKGVKSNKTMQLFRRSFVNKKVNVNISRGRIVGELIP